MRTFKIDVGELTVQWALQYMPDKTERLHCLPRLERMTLAELGLLFGCDPLMVTCWACLLHGIEDKHRATFENASTDALRKHMALKRANGNMGPRPATVAKALAESAS